MATPPDFVSGAVLTAAQMNGIGLWLVKTQTIGTGVSSVIVTSAFSSDYDNYLIHVADTTCNTLNDVFTCQMRTGSTTATTSYNNATPYGTYAGTSGAFTTANTSSFNLVGRAFAVNDKVSFSFELRQPFLANKTSYCAMVSGSDLAGASGGYHNSATSYDQFVLNTAGTMTGGTIRVYGYRK